jgi:sugar phosphate permease
MELEVKKVRTVYSFTKYHIELVTHPGWEWIFILEGLATIVISVASYWVIQDFPTTAKFLTEKERKSQFCITMNISNAFPLGRFVVHRLMEDRRLSAGGEHFQIKFIRQSLTDWKTWVASKSLHTCIGEGN